MKLNTTELPGYYIFRIAHNLRLLHDEELNSWELTSSQWKVLKCLWNKDGITQKEISNSMNIKPSSLTKLIDILEKKDMVIRKYDSSDARAKLIFLTEKGISLEQKSCEIIKSLESTLIKGLDDTEANEFLRLLKIANKNVTLD
ncbi:hypothetical protein SH2C18_39210 [Clostridium sediminicola]|uniref:MarR family winged helix-turn-helix transcriptional regulator n=1 Tax=Clostridium sediminicola TaxID=3114879 RepID=UPI0031F1DEA3